MPTFTVTYNNVIADSPGHAAAIAESFPVEIRSSKGTVWGLNELGEAYEDTASPTTNAPTANGKAYTVLYEDVVAESPEDAEAHAPYLSAEIIDSRGAHFRIDEHGEAYEVAPPVPATKEPEAPARRFPRTPDQPITKDLIERFNPLTHFPKTVDAENRRFEQDTKNERDEAQKKLAAFGVTELPSDVELALDRLKHARFALFQARVRSRELAPPWTVVGPARYNEHASPKRAESLERRGFEGLAIAQAYLGRAIRRYAPNRGISSDDPRAIEMLEMRIDQAEQRQTTMKAANVIVRSKKVATSELKVELLTELGISWERAHKLLKEDFAGRVGFPPYEFQNNLANINRMKGRVEQLQRERSTPTAETSFPGGRIVDNAEANRVQMFFDEKPSRPVIDLLKSNGFHWTPTLNCWQRQRSDNARAVAQYVVGQIPTLEKQTVARER